jgi:quercetin dioxygenase-like cupin family protein
MENGWRRKVLFSGELTFVLLEAKGPTSGPIELHRHVNDQISYVVEGEIIAQVGKESRRIGKGGFFRVPSNAPHGIQILSSSVQLIDAFTPPREDFRR